VFNFTPVFHGNDVVGLQVTVIGIFEHYHRQKGTEFTYQFIMILNHYIHLVFLANGQFAEKVHIAGGI